VRAVNRAADAAPATRRGSREAKATVKLGPVSRQGRSRVAVAAADQDGPPAGTVTPVGLRRPALGALVRAGVTARVTRDGLVDRLAQWWAGVGARLAHSTTLVLNLANGPERHRHRTPCVARLVAFAAAAGLTIRRADYPPDHSKDHPVARCWGVLEQHRNGTLRDALAAVLGFAATLTGNGTRPTVALVTTADERGVTLTKAAMAQVAARRIRHPTRGKWFVAILPAPTTGES
jgi:hypothetical protein